MNYYQQKKKTIRLVFLCALIAAGAFFLEEEKFSLAETDTTVTETDSAVTETGSTSFSEPSNSFIYPSTIEAGGSVKVQLQISNALAEISSVGIKVISPSGSYSAGIEEMLCEQDYWSGDIFIPGDAEAGIWKTKIIISYATGEIKEYFPDAGFTVIAGENSTTGAVSQNNTCASFDYSGWSFCQDGEQTRTITASYPSGCQGGYPILLQACSDYIDQTCSEDVWACEEWGLCIDGYQKRFCEKTLECENVETPVPAFQQKCDSAAVSYCQYAFSDYGPCENGKQYRKIASRYPEGCVDKLTEPLERECNSAETLKECSYVYSAWSECQNGMRTRTILSSPSDCLPGTPVLKEECGNARNCVEDDWKCGEWSSCVSSTKQYRSCSLVSNCIIVSETKPQIARECLALSSSQGIEEKGGGQVFQTGQSQETNGVKEVLNTDLSRKNLEEYVLYSRQDEIIKECLSKGLNRQEECRRYYLEKYGKPLKCEGLSEENCASLIDNLILSDLKNAVNPEESKSLKDYGGKIAIINSANKTLVIEEEKEDQSSGEKKFETKEIAISNSPLAPTSKEMPIILSSMVVQESQKILSPVAVVFDSNKNGIPDDTEKRMNIVPTDVKLLKEEEISSLSGVDQALIGGKPLEQPKFSSGLNIKESLTVSSVETIQTGDSQSGILKLQGRAEPNQVVTLFVYSVMPIVLTVKADDYGNWVYEMDKSLVDGKHEVYAAINNSEGRIIEASLPAPFFIQEAKAVTLEEFAGGYEASAVPDSPSRMINLYLASGTAFIVLLIAGFLFIRKKMA